MQGLFYSSSFQLTLCLQNLTRILAIIAFKSNSRAVHAVLLHKDMIQHFSRKACLKVLCHSQEIKILPQETVHATGIPSPGEYSYLNNSRPETYISLCLILQSMQRCPHAMLRCQKYLSQQVLQKPWAPLICWATPQNIN